MYVNIDILYIYGYVHLIFTHSQLHLDLSLNVLIFPLAHWHFLEKNGIIILQQEFYECMQMNAIILFIVGWQVPVLSHISFKCLH